VAIDVTTMTAEIKTALNRGSRYDADIPIAIVDAIDLMERNHGFVFGEFEQQVTLLEDAFEVELPPLAGGSAPIKPRFIIEGGVKFAADPFLPLPKVPREQFRDRTKGILNGFLTKLKLDGTFWIEFDNTARADTVFNTMAAYFTSTAGEIAIRNHSQLVKAQSILFIAPIMRSPNLRAFWTERRDEALRAALNSDDMARFEGNDMSVQPYAAELEELQGYIND